VSWPVLARIEGWPNLLPEDIRGLVTLTGGWAGLTERLADTVSGVRWPEPARREG